MRKLPLHLLVFVSWLLFAVMLTDLLQGRAPQRATTTTVTTPVKITPVESARATSKPPLDEFALYRYQGVLCTALDNDYERSAWGKPVRLLHTIDPPPGYPPCE